MNSNKTFATSIAGRADLNVSNFGQHQLAAMLFRSRGRWSAMSHAAVLLLGTICGPVLAQNWIEEVPDHNPPARYQGAMANDGATGMVVLFGGFGNAGRLSDTWSWDGADWIEESPAHTPPARDAAVMAYDAVHGKVVLFGGYGNGGFLSDTWVWDGTDWTQETPATVPPFRLYGAMKFDAARGQMILFGGLGTSNTYLNDTWLWNGKNWTQAEPGTSPSGRCASAMAYDAAENKVVMFGGYNPTNEILSDTWEWDGSNWIEQNPPVSPSGRYYSGMAYDSVQSRVVLFGGVGLSYLNDTWEGNGATWTQQTPPDFPSLRYGQAMAPDPQGYVVMFGGYNGTSGLFSDTWVWTTGPKASLNPTNLSFGKQKVKTSSAGKQIKVTNSGVNTLTLQSIAFSGSDPKDFEESNNCHGSLKPGFSCTVEVTFKPTAKGTRSAKLVVKDNAQNGSQSIAVSGSGD